MAIDFKSKMNRSVHDDIIQPAININTKIDSNINIIQQPPKYTDVHKATLVYLENELSNELDEVCKGKKGLKSKIINEALRQYLKPSK